jgi:class 3 adenylate cyclase/predicted ATPase
MDISAWLRSLDLERYEQAFRENAINEASLPKLTAEDLRDLGVTAVGHRRILLDAIAALRTERPDRSGGKAQAERRQLTVMFADLVGSTALSARLDPEELRDIIGAYHRRCAEVITSSVGFVAKYLGDGVLAYFGYPQAHEEDAEQAVRAGLALIDAVAKLHASQATSLRVRVGIATGLVVVGDLLGEGAAQEEAVIGETPNLAARLQALAEPNTVVIADNTRRLLGGLFDYCDLGPLAIAGLDHPVHVWRVLGASLVGSRFEALRAASTPLVGREEEIALLIRRWERAKAGDGSVVLIAGEPGIGKSRIAQTLLEQLGKEPHTRLRYFCSPHYQNSALYPSIAQLERAAGFRREDTDEQRLEKLEAILAQGTNDLREAVPLLADLLNIPTGDRYPPLNFTPRKRKERTLLAQLAQVEGLAAQQPVLMVFEDVHWSDPTTRESLDLLIDRIPSLRVLLVLTFRPEFALPWGGRPHVTMLNLNRLARRQRAEMIAHVTGGKPLPKEIADQIIDRTDGVPLFVEELTKAVIESGVLTDAGDHFMVTGALAPLTIPTSLHASLLARLDRLAPVREVAQIGAALGRSFSHELISAVAEMPQQQLDQALVQLVRAELMFRRGTPPDAEYTFKHALVQDAAYSTLLRSRRQQIHARIAESIGTHSPELAETQPELLAQHCTKAGLVEKSIVYWRKAGHSSAARSAMAEAAAQFQTGLHQLALMPDTPERQRQELEVLIALGAVLQAVKGQAAPETGHAYARAREVWEQLGCPSEFLQVPWGQSLHHVYRGELGQAQRLDQELLRLSLDRKDSSALVIAYYSLGRNLLYAGEFSSARMHLERAISLYDPHTHDSLRHQAGDDPRVNSQAALAIALFCIGFPVQAVAQSNAAIAEAQKLAHPPSLALSLAFGARLMLFAGDDRRLRERANRLIELATDRDFPFWYALGRVFLGWVMVRSGDIEEGISLLSDGSNAYRATGAELWAPYNIALLARAYGISGQVEAGLACSDEALRILERTRVRSFAADVYRDRGDLMLRQRQPEAAQELYCKALSVAREQQARSWELRAATSLARLWRDQGKCKRACDLLTPIYGWFTEGFDTPDLKEAKALLEQLTK